MGRAALSLEAEGVLTLFGSEAISHGVFRGDQAIRGGWRTVTAEVHAVYDRFPSQGHPEPYLRLRRLLGHLPWVNPPDLIALCRDKLATQELLHTVGSWPPVERDPDRFHQRLSDWGAAFIKPRFGSFGAGVRRVVPGDRLPSKLQGTVPNTLEPAILQRAIHPPPSFQGVSVRVNMQRDTGGVWVINSPVARTSELDPVVNAATGAEVSPAHQILPLGTLKECTQQATAVAHRFESRWGDVVAELGVDLVIDHHEHPWLIEVNARPRGRLAALAGAWPQRFADEHLQATARPIRYAAGLSEG